MHSKTTGAADHVPQQPGGSDGEREPEDPADFP